MIQRIQNLSLVLERMLVLYERVLDLLDRERTQLILLDFENLYPVMREKDEILAALRALDKDRLRIQDQCALIMGQDPLEITLRKIGELLIEEGSSSETLGRNLLNLRLRMATVIEVLRERVGRNQNFIEKSVASLQSVAGHLSRSVAGKSTRKNKVGTYTGKAKIAVDPEQSGSIVEKRL